MRNKVTIKNDGINVYITLLVKSHIVGNIVVALVIVALIGLLFYLPTTISKEEITTYIIPLIFFAIVIVTVFVRYLLWNVYGKENVIVNTKSVSYYRDYGLYRTNLKTVLHTSLETGIEWTRTFEDIKYGNLIFNDYNTETNLPEHLYTTSVVLTFEELEKIQDEIETLYVVDTEDTLDFSTISLN